MTNELIAEILQKAFLTQTETELLEQIVQRIPQEFIKKFAYTLFCDSYGFNAKNQKTTISLPMIVFYAKKIFKEKSMQLTEAEFLQALQDQELLSQGIGMGLKNKLTRKHYKNLIGNQLKEIIPYDDI